MASAVSETPLEVPPPSKYTSSDIQLSGRHFTDQHGRILYLRGVNVGAASKVPNSPTGRINEHRGVSYIGRPFPLSEAPIHWKRLRAWGLNFVRITVTWDAIEHAGPGEYDIEYLDYLRQLLESMKEYGIVCYVAIHQDVWSRYSGGSGAPGWTLEAAGFDLSDDGEKLAISGAAFLDGIKGGRLSGERGLWPTGYQKLAAATMNTLFWGGRTLAPSLMVSTPSGPKNIQDHLQDCFLGAVSRLAEAVGDLPSVMGIELLNEPHPGFIGLPSIHEWNYNTDLHLGDFPSPLQSFAMGAGHPTNVPHYTRSFPFPTRKSRYVTANTQGVSAWKEGACPWEKEGVWRWSEQKCKAIALQEDYFSKIKGTDGKMRLIDFYHDFYWPFVRKWEGAIAASKFGASKGKGKEKMRMVEIIPNEFCPAWPEDARSNNLVYAPHWYDLNALFKKQMGFMTVNVQGLSRGMFVLKGLYFGRLGVKKNYALQIRTIVENARKSLGEVPIVFGECGVPMDLNNETALKTGDWQWQERMMDAMISALESSLVAFNLWTYNPANRDDIGDDWNAENFSFYSDHNRSKAITSKGGSQEEDFDEDFDAGGRLLDAVVRPYAIATAGTPTSLSYDVQTTMFAYFFTSPIYSNFGEKDGNANAIPPLSEVTEIFLPKRVYKSVESIGHYLSPGGKIVLDLEISRAYVWFDDSALPPPRSAGQPKNRVVKIWVRDRTNVDQTKGVSPEMLALAVLWVFIGIYWYDKSMVLSWVGVKG